MASSSQGFPIETPWARAPATRMPRSAEARASRWAVTDRGLDALGRRPTNRTRHRRHFLPGRSFPVRITRLSPLIDPHRPRPSRAGLEPVALPLLRRDWDTATTANCVEGGRAMAETTTRVMDADGPPVPEMIEPSVWADDRRHLSTRELLSRVVRTGSRLVSKEIELARAELKADIESELAMIKMLAAAAVGALLGVNLLLVALVIGLSHWIPAWLAAVALGALILVVSALVGYIGWQRRVSKPLAVTRRTVTEDVQ